MITFLKVFCSALLVFMIYIVVKTSLESNLFEEWDFLASIPWMTATLWDFYANIVIIWFWVVYKETRVVWWIVWAVLFFCLGSIATLGYLLIQLFKLKSGENIKELLLNKN